MGPRPVLTSRKLKSKAHGPWAHATVQGRTGQGPVLHHPTYGMTFNLDAPPNFRGLDPDKPVRIYTRNLPHWRQEGATYFVTFNLADALPSAKKEQLKSMRREWELRHPPPRDEETWTEFAKAVFRAVEKWMDAGHGRCWFKNKRYAKELHRSILHFHGTRYEIGCFVIMANHCHLVM